MILSLMLCSLTVGGSARLVFDGDSLDLDNYDILVSIRDGGELINTTTRPLHFCPEVDERIDVYRVYLRQEDGEEREKYVELSTRLDLTYIHNKVSNAEEPWIKTDILKRPYLNCFDQDDPFLIDTIRKDHLKPPSQEPYNFSVPEQTVKTFGQMGQPVYLDMVIFKEQVKNGFFIEAGASDFETDSNSLLFELKHQWTGLLVEPNPIVYPKGILKQRKAWASTSCFSTKTRPEFVPFSQRVMTWGMAGIAQHYGEATHELQCFPFYTLLMAAANVTVNYLSLDIEGAELAVLQTIPWDKVDIEVITVETKHAGEVFPGTRQDIIEYLAQQGYVHDYMIAELDDVFIRKDLYHGKYKPHPERLKYFQQEYDLTECTNVV